VSDLCTFEEIAADAVDVVGGKGLSLGLMARAGLPVPPGFCITSAAFRRCRGQGVKEVAEQIGSAYRALGTGLVAVRSSATAEDGAVTSFAGQQETILGVEGEPAVCAAVERCWASLDTERARAYRLHQGINDESLAMAVVVQRLVPAEVAGVLFTRDPLDPEGRRMLVEASWGLGEAVVSGRVMPDRFHLDRERGAVLDRHISVKKVQVTGKGPEAVPVERQSQPCLDDAQLRELVELGKRVEAFYGAPRDVEWAWADGRFWLLQARPITTADAAEREQVRRVETAQLAARAEPSGTVWSRFNLSEILPQPTPMTWAIVRRFMSGRGGFGLMYRDLGFDPDPSLDDEGIFDLVCGRPYCNLSREPRMHFRQVPLKYSFAALKEDHGKALYPSQPVLDSDRAGWRFWLSLPVISITLAFKAARHKRLLQHYMQTFGPRFRQEIIPTFMREVEAERNQDLTGFASSALLERLEHWTRRTLDEFARESLKPTALARIGMTTLEQQLAQTLDPVRAQEKVRDLIMGVHPDPDADLAQAIRDVAAGRLQRDEFLKGFGHHGNQEMELSQPRWSEEPASLDRSLATAARSSAATTPKIANHWDEIAAEARLNPPQKTALKAELDLIHLHLGLRETAKHYLMHGYALMRRILVELDRRHRLNGGIFYLTPTELPALVKGADLTREIAARRRRRALALSLEVPQVLFSDDLDAIGRAPELANIAELKGVPLSAGVAEAPALVLEEPLTENVPQEPYILVCPSTDPAWVPLFVQAAGLVMETGGVLSHGAIVAREFGLPAVAGLPGVQQQLRTGQRLRVDGVHGTVAVLPG
jgi:pyruvate,water dikinase